GGPKILLFESRSIQELGNYFIQEKKASVYNFVDAFERAGEDYTIIFITDKITDVVDLREVSNAFIIKEEPDVILCNLLNDKMTHLVDRSRIATRIIILRAVGDLEKVIKEISDDYKCVEGDIIQIFNSHNEKGTVVAFTDKPIHRTVSMKDMYKKALFIEERYRPLMRSLRSHALKYLNSGLGNKDWYELEIRIFDRYSEYDLHYERLLNIMDWLELGIILGESWGKDYPRPMMAVEVYRVRFFTFYEPLYIKKILLGLELLDDSTRIVDYDLYFNRKKLNWSDAADEGIKVRHLIGVKYRKEILSKLSDKEIAELYEMEERILATRT
ncbi:MAG: hypothetical protein VB106_16375, partial [Clostridiaceae bacterium]|nr:hypothetical protein [Clostridiaceae bacterium]